MQITAYASAAAAVVPVPFTDLALLLPFHSAMVLTVGHCLGRKLTDAEAKRVAIELGTIAGATIAGRVAIGVLKKFVFPLVGGLLAAPASFAVTWAFGRLTIAYFRDPNLSRDDLNSIFKDAMKEGSKNFSKEAFDRFRRGQNQGDTGPSDDEAPTEDNPPKGDGASGPTQEAPPRPADPTLKTKKRSL